MKKALPGNRKQGSRRTPPTKTSQGFAPTNRFPSSELVFGVVCPIGTNHQAFVTALGNHLGQFGYRLNQVRLSDHFDQFCRELGISFKKVPPTNQSALAHEKIRIGNEIRNRSGLMDALGLAAAATICDTRLTKGRARKSSSDPLVLEPMEKTAHVICTLKRPEEVESLRRIYGEGFFLIGLVASRAARDQYLAERGISDIEDLIAKDQMEMKGSIPKYSGQQTRDTFHMADVFLSMDDLSGQTGRFLDLVFASGRHTPTADEHAMFLAYSASLRSGDLARQVGASIVDTGGNLLAVGYNEVPRPGGGLYGPGPESKRDLDREFDSNDSAKTELIKRIVLALDRPALSIKSAAKRLKPTGLLDITEFGRSVHAEMEALLSCARTGRSPHGAVLYTTTFPCHNCARHIVGAGISKVIYIEPYAKSKASILHDDAVSVDCEESGKLPFQQFIGVGPRRYFDLFSLSLSSGDPIERKIDGKLKPWDRSSAPPRFQMKPNSYLEREALALRALRDTLRNSKSHA